MSDDQPAVRRYIEGEPVPEDSMAVQAAFAVMDVVRVEVTSLENEGQKFVYVVFRNLDNIEGDAFDQIRELTRARGNNLWYRVMDSGFAMETNTERLIALEQTLHFYEDERKQNLQ